MRNPQLTSIVPYRRAPVPGAMEAAFAEFLRVDVASGDASLDTIEHYLNEVEYWVAWCAEQGFDPATITTAHIKDVYKRQEPSPRRRRIRKPR